MTNPTKFIHIAQTIFLIVKLKKRYTKKRPLKYSVVKKGPKGAQKVTLTKNWSQRLSEVFAEESNLIFDEPLPERPVTPQDLEEDQEEQHEETEKEEDESDDDKSDEEDNEGIIADADEYKDCCWTYPPLSMQVLHNYINVLHQFHDKVPDLPCLLLCLKSLSSIFEMLHKSPSRTNKTNLLIKECTKFRHDCLAYLCLSNYTGESVKFGTDASLQFLGSYRTPDFVELKGKSLTIIEFTIVGNVLRGNFMKGINQDTSKYKNEIITAKSLGYEVVYKPVICSYNMTIEENLEMLSNQNILIPENEIPFLQAILNSIPNEYMYLVSLSFIKETPIDLNLNRKEAGWTYEYKSVNQKRFLSFVTNASKLDRDFKYAIYFTATTNIISRDQGKYLGSYLQDLAKDELLLYKVFEKDLRGKKHMLLKGMNRMDDMMATTEAHLLESEPTDHAELYDNELAFDKFSSNQYDKFNKLFLSEEKGDLVKPFNISAIQQAVSDYKGRLKLYQTPRNTLPVLLNKPRRSFSNTINTEFTYDCLYSSGISLNYGGNTISVKLIMEDLSKVKFEKMTYITDKPDNYKIAQQELYDWLQDKLPTANVHKFSLKRLKKDLHPQDLATFEMLSKKSADAQTNYLKNLKKSNSGVLLINQDIKEAIKGELDWKGGGLYKLYMGKPQSLKALKDTIFQKTKRINFHFSMPDIKDTPMFEDLKRIQIDVLNNHLNEATCTVLFQMLVLHSRLCYTLLALSNRNENNRYVTLDNLGLTNVLLIVKGGKKILNTRKSKIFKLITPIQRALSDYSPGNYVKDSVFFNESSWMQLSQTQLLDGIALPYKYLLNFSSLRSKQTLEEVQDTLFLPTMLALHNRRKTEINLHNMRYFMVNVLAEFSQVDKLLQDFDTPCYSAFDHAIYHGFSQNYLKYVNTVREWRGLGSNDKTSFQYKPVAHPILDRCIFDINDYSYTIYSTYMMSKTVDNQSLEQVNNLQTVVETHKYFLDNQPNDWQDIKGLYKSDFNYSPEVSYEVGKVLSAMIRKNHGVKSIYVKYNQTMDTPIDIMANNRGLRYKDEMFFGHKGYYVVYKELMNQNVEEILSILKETEDSKLVYKKLKELNVTFRQQQKEQPLDKVVFHIVDKVQRGGPREIYVMDYNTKLHQHTIEKMFKIICSLVDNEMITIPSGRRAAHIHHKNFEFGSDNYVKYNLTLDCRKWAPRSNFNKYIHMLEGMLDVLPNEFIVQVKDFFSKYSSKQIHTRTEIAQQLFKRDNSAAQYFEESPSTKSSFLTMPYSFVMGIFNMLSSLYHAGVQLLAERQVMLNNYLRHSTIVNLLMDAHSDDSVGSLCIEAKKSNTAKDYTDICSESLSYYQHLQKSCNHLMSIKKCNISKEYLEFLSILYINNELIPLLPKFLSNFTGVFSGKGISHDFRSVISKSIELQTNGETHDNCFRAQVIMSNFYRNFYRIEHDTTLPSLGGFAASWPPLYIYFGSCIDEVRLSYTWPSLFLRIMTFARENLEFEPTEGTFSLNHCTVSRLPKAYRDIKKAITLPEFQDNKWFFSQNKTRNAKLNVLWFRAMLDDPNFMISLLNINEVRRAVDSLRLASFKTIKTNAGMLDINELYVAILKTEPADISYYKIYTTYFKSAIEFYEDTTLLGQHSLEDKISISYKPCNLNLNDMNDVPVPKGNSLSVAVNLCDKSLKKYLFEDVEYDLSLERFRKFLTDQDIPIDLRTVKNFLDFVNKRKEKTFYMYNKVPSNGRVMVGSHGMLQQMQNAYSETKKLMFNVNSFRLAHRNKQEIDDSIIALVNSLYLFHLAKLSKDADLMMLPIKIGGRTLTLNSVYDYISTMDDIYTSFTYYIGSTDNTTIDLHTLPGFAIWIDRQYKVVGEWVGKGSLYVKLKEVNLIFYANNNIIERCETDSEQDFILGQSECDFLNLILENNNLNIENIPRGAAGHYIGYNKSGQMSICKGELARLGVPCYLNCDIKSLIPKQVQIHYDYGKYIARFNGNNYTVQTFDGMCYKVNKGRLFDLTDWDSMSAYQKSLLLKASTSGRFGDVGLLNYDLDDIITNFMNTELYRTFYKNTIKDKQDLLRVIWSDVLNSTTSSDEILPIMFENTGLADITKILPESKKDNLRILQFFNTDSNLLFNLKSNIASLDSDSMKVDYLIKVIGDIGNNPALAKLPEIGDPAAFTQLSYQKKNLTINSCNTLWSDFSHAIVKGFEKLNTRDKQSILRGSKSGFDFNHVYKTFLELLTIKEVEINEYSSFNFDTLMVHSCLDKIFSNQYALLAFSKELRVSSLSKVPRHPLYKEEWQKLLASFYKYAACPRLQPENLDHIPELQKYRIKPTELERPFISPLISLPYETDFDFDDLNEYTIQLYALGRFETTQNKFEMSKAVIEDFIDEEEQEWDRVRTKEGRNITVKLEAGPQALSGTVATRTFVPLKNVFSKYIQKKKYYLYNCNPDIAKSEGWIPDNCSYELRTCKKFENFYSEEPPLMYKKLLEIKQIPNFAMPTTHFIQTYNLHDPATYNDSTFKQMAESYNMDSKEKEVFKEVFFSNKSPIVKAMNIARYLNKMNDKETDLGELINKALNRLTANIHIDNLSEDLVRLDYLSAGANKRDILLKASGFKDEILQLDTLFPKLASDLVIGNVKLDNFRKSSLSKQLNTIILHYKSKNMRDKVAFFSFLKRFLKSLDEDSNSNHLGLQLEESIRILIDKNSEDITDDEDTDDAFDEPKHEVMTWRVNR
jgi:hypothetical protein